MLHYIEYDQRDRSEILSEVKRVVVKVGSAVLTAEDGLRTDIIASLAKQIAFLRSKDIDVVLVSSGAVAAGRAVLHNSHTPDIKGVPDRQAAAAIGQSRLMRAYQMAFEPYETLTAQLLLTKDDFQSQRRYLNANNTFSRLFSWKVLPIVNENDTVVVKELEFGDNDSLAVLLLNMVQADLFVNLTSARGLCSGNPDTDPDARILDCVEDIEVINLKAMCGGKTTVGSGGMYSKMLAARRAAQLSVPTLVLSGKEPDAIIKAFEGEPLGTWIRARHKGIPRRKFSLAYNTPPKGVVSIDSGAVNALLHHGKSLLAVGITKVEGNFDRGALVRISDPEGIVIAVGCSNYKSSDLRRIAGVKCSNIESILGFNHQEAIHRDNMLLDAVV